MISIDVMGGLGNQLFMVFATLAYGIQHNVKVIFPYHNCYYDPNRPTYWETLLKDLVIFTVNYSENNVSEQDRCNFSRYYEKGFEYDPIPLFREQNVCLGGYFQNPQYFEQQKETIFKLIHLYDKKADIRTKYTELFSVNEDGQILCIHFRMGDYKTKRIHHPIMNYEYFEKALDTVIEKQSKVQKVFYLCEREDNEYVQRHIQQLNTKYPMLTFMKVDDQLPDYEQLLVMSCCHHNIIANSTFSWWGAYLNDTPDKTVCFPSVWFGIGYPHHTHLDMMPKEWVKIDANPKPHDQPL
jgi:hypothetical protein